VFAIAAATNGRSFQLVGANPPTHHGQPQQALPALHTLQTSVTAATITVERLAPGIQSKVDLMGRRVGLSTFFNGTLPPRAIPIRYDSDGAMLEALLSREVDALMLPFSYLITSLIYDCRVEIASEPFSWFDRAIALPPGRRNDALIAAMNAALLELQTLGEDTGMSSRYWPSVEEEVCPYYNPSSHISLDQVRPAQQGMSAWLSNDSTAIAAHSTLKGSCIWLRVPISVPLMPASAGVRPLGCPGWWCPARTPPGQLAAGGSLAGSTPPRGSPAG
jgi:hypothetical protein